MPIPAATSNTVETNFNLFTNGNVSVNSNISIGDIIGAMAVGGVAYIAIVLSFLIGLFAVSKFYLSQGQGADPSGGMNLFRLALKPLLWLLGGVFVYTAFVMLIEGWYKISVDNRLKFFLEARYDLLVGNIEAKGSLLGWAKNLLFALDIFSTFAFWSIALIFIVLITTIFSYVISILLEKSDEYALFKKLFTATVTTVIATVLITIYNVNVNRVFFSNNATINKIGQVTSVYDANVKVVKFWVKTALN